MKNHLLFATFAMSIAFCANAASSVDDYAWHNRLLIVFAGAPDSPELAKQRALMSSTRDAASERDLQGIEVIGDRVSGASDSADALRKRYGVARDAFRVLLVGKDGGVKMDSKQPIEPQRIFGTIDTMPMRRQEAKPKS